MRNRIAFLLLSLSLVGCATKEARQTTDTSHVSIDSSLAAKGSLYILDMTFENQNAQPVAWKSLEGKVQVMAMVFTHCAAACPRVTEDIKATEKLIGQNPNVGYTLVSFDTKRDTAARLMQFYTDHNLDANWKLLHGSEEDVRTVGNLFDVKFKQDADGSFEHQNVILVIDKQGHIALRREGLGGDPKQLADKVKSLL